MWLLSLKAEAQAQPRTVQKDN